jgi:hypothetical protein
MCNRCGYETYKLSNYKSHLSRKRICNDINNSNLSQKDLLEDLNKILKIEKSNSYICKYCKENFNTSLKKHRHKKIFLKII